MKHIKEHKIIFISIILIGFIIYFPMLFNGFVWDDIGAFLHNPKIHTFSFSVFFDNVYNTNQEYRQFMPFFWSLFYTLFGENAFPYHLTQLLLHIFCAMLLFLLYKHYFSKKISWIVSLLFLVHPINSEAVLWLSSIETQAYMSFGLLALLILHKEKVTNRNLIGAAILLFLSLLSYEAGILYYPLAICYLYLQKKQYLKRYIIFIILSTIIYIYLRILGGLFHFTFFVDNHYSPTTFAQRLYTMPNIIFYYLKVFLFPQNLMIWQSWAVREFSFSQVLIPAFVIQVGILFYLLVLKGIKAKKEPIYFFTFWFLLGMITLLQIYPLDMTVSERWFYFPIVGLLGIIGFFATYYQKIIKKYTLAITIFLIIILSGYSVRTFIRTFDWKNNSTLYTHDVNTEPNNYRLLYEIGGIYFNQKKYKQAIPYIEKVAAGHPNYSNTLVELGIMYEGMGEYDQAAYYYKRVQNEMSVPFYNAVFDSNLALANVYLKAKKYKEIQDLLSDNIINNSKNAMQLRMIRAQANVKLNKYEDALLDAEYLYNNSNDLYIIEFYKKIKAERDMAMQPE